MACADLEGGGGGFRPPPEFAKLNIADITGSEKNSNFFIFVHFHSYTLIKIGPPLEKFSGSAPVWVYKQTNEQINVKLLVYI